MPSILIFAGLHGLLAVTLGAFAAHSDVDFLDTKAMAWLETGVRYGLVHAAVLLVLGLRDRRAEGRLYGITAWLFVFGITAFSGGLYLMALSGWRGLGMIVPFGGLLLILAWGLVIAYGILRWVRRVELQWLAFSGQHR
jgi:uncharacterized membrane protein YgdD (TMEM256/DUF423 family)